MKYSLLALVAATCIATAQEFRLESSAASEWFQVRFEERDRQFRAQEVDADWAQPMEQAIAEEIAHWANPPVKLVDAECRETLCRIDTSWPRNVGLAETGQQLSYLHKLGLDHQGETRESYEGDRFRWVVILRRL